MRILYDGTAYQSQRKGGITRYFDKVISTMSSLRPEWEFDIQIPGRALCRPLGCPNAKTYFLPYLEPRQFYFPINYCIRRFHAHRGKYDLLHSTLCRPFRWAPYPIVSTIHDVVEERFPNLFPNRRMAYWKRWSAKRARAIITVSEHSKREICEVLDVDQAKVHVIYNGVDETFNPASPVEYLPWCKNRSINRPYVLYIGHRGGHKNFCYLAKAFDQLPIEISLVLVGGDSSPDLSAMLSQRRCRVTHLPDVNDSELRLLYSGALALIFPSLYEGFGLPPLEAMACGTAVVATDIPSTKEICQDAAFYCSSDDPASLKDAIWFASIPHERNRRIALGLRRASHFRWADCARQTIAVYERVV